MSARRLFVAVDSQGATHSRSTIRRGFIYCVVARAPKVDHIRFADAVKTFKAKAWTAQPHLAEHQRRRWLQVFEEVAVLNVREVGHG